MASGSSSQAVVTALSNDFFGWDLLYKTVDEMVNRKSDLLIALAHFILVKHYKMQCLGVGEDKTLTKDDVGAELLPVGWNECSRYSLRYKHNGLLYLLLGHPNEKFIQINLFDVKHLKVTNLTLNTESVVKQLQGTLLQMMPDVTSLVSRYRLELVDPVFTGNTREVTTQTSGVQDTRNQQSRSPNRNWHPADPYSFDPYGYIDDDDTDMDPWGLLPPHPDLVGGRRYSFSMPSYPEVGGINPRFDAYGPDGQIRRGDPNPNHMRPSNSDPNI